MADIDAITPTPPLIFISLFRLPLIFTRGARQEGQRGSVRSQRVRARARKSAFAAAAMLPIRRRCLCLPAMSRFRRLFHTLSSTLLDAPLLLRSKRSTAPFTRCRPRQIDDRPGAR